ncbi:hypothetical protein L1887_28019 [Cichorium endivia]|nr:hypothetical protein L1887_28019 [Cichorium endivia]
MDGGKTPLSSHVGAGANLKKTPQGVVCMGNAQTSFAFLTPDIDVAKDYFDSAYTYFHQVLEEDLTGTPQRLNVP